jgi:hypothetical protein
MFTRKVALIAFAAAVGAVVMASSSPAASQSGPLTTTHNLTFSRTVALPGVTLPAGTYVFERDSNANGIVRVMTPNYQRMLYVGFTARVLRPRGFQSAVSFGEAKAGEPIPIVAWYPVGSSEGHKFLYR